MSWLLAFLGFVALILLHELGHFVAAKAVGMRVERFSLFFPPLLLRRQGRGETEYAIGAIPLGGYVKISGMSPYEELPPEVAHRAYLRQPVWKRVVVILAGPVVNIVIALILFTALTLGEGRPSGALVDRVDRGTPAAQVLQDGDVIRTVDGRSGTFAELTEQIRTHTCEAPRRVGCAAATPAVLTVERDGLTRTVQVRPRLTEVELSNGDVSRAMRLGFVPGEAFEPVGVGGAAGYATERMWFITSTTVSILAQLFRAEQREQLSGVVGSYEVTRQAFSLDATTALTILAIISLSLGIINLFPFLPLDGGHIFWAVAEKVRGKPVSFAVMERAGFVGFALVAMLFLIGLSNDITRLSEGGFSLR